MTSKKAKEKPIIKPFFNWSGINGFVKRDNSNIPEKKDLRREGKFSNKKIIIEEKDIAAKNMPRTRKSKKLPSIPSQASLIFNLYIFFMKEEFIWERAFINLW